MASRTSSSRGRGSSKSRGKNISLHQNGSSTLNQSGLSTQSFVQSKQTKEDYAFPIQTLQAFQEQGLTTLPKKTWASIADDDSYQDLPSLQTIIQTQKSQVIQANPKPIQSTLPRQEYLKKPISKFVMLIEPEYWDQTSGELVADKTASKVFPTSSHLEPISHNKTQNFYEFILVDTDSVAIKHFRD